jgi:exodeoxyribonuclease-3
MKLATFNINGINKRLGNLLAWLGAAKPDIVCLQELKCTDRQFPATALAEIGYGAVWVGEPNWNGVAILARGLEPIVTQTALPGDTGDAQARYIEAAVDGTIIGCLYAPNGNPQPGPKFNYKLNWHARFNAHAQELLDSGLPVVLAGDFNVVPQPRDIYATTSYDDNALVQPKPRASYAALLAQGWIDTLRHTHPDEVIYSFWDYRRKRWERNGGLRIDHILIPPKMRTRLKGTGVDREVRGEENASDHAPVWAEIGSPKSKSPPSAREAEPKAARRSASVGRE